MKHPNTTILTNAFFTIKFYSLCLTFLPYPKLKLSLTVAEQRRAVAVGLENIGCWAWVRRRGQTPSMLSATARRRT
jgi:hypothetical protein